MNLSVTLIFNLKQLNNLAKEEVQFQFSFEDDSLKLFQREKEIIKEKKYWWEAVDALTISIGKKKQENKEIDDQVIEDFLLSQFKSTLDYILENSILSEQCDFSIEISHQDFQIVSLLSNWMQNLNEINQLEILQFYPFSEEQNILFFSVINDKFLKLKILNYNIALPSSEARNDIKQSIKINSNRLQEISFEAIKSIQEIQILQYFPNLRTLKLFFPITSCTSFIDQSLIRASQFAPNIQALQLIIETPSQCYLSKSINFSSLQNLKIVSKSEIKFQFSHSRNLTFISIESPDPFSFFCKQKKLESLQKLSLFSVGEVMKENQDEKKNEIEKFSKAMLLHKKLNQLIFIIQGDNSSRELIKRDLEIIFIVCGQLKMLDVKLLPCKSVRNEEIEEELVTILCKLLDKCKQEIRINYSLKTSSLSINSKCDLSLAIRRLTHTHLFSLNGELIMQQMMQSTSHTYRTVQMIPSSFQNQNDDSLCVIYLGILAHKHFLSNTIYFRNEEISILTNQKNVDIQNKIRELLHPFQRIEVKDINFDHSSYFSRDLIYIKMASSMNLKIIDDLIEAYPKLLQISGKCLNIKQISSNDPSYLPKRNIELIIQMQCYSYETICQLIKIPGHIFKMKFEQHFENSLFKTKELALLIAESNFKVLIFYEIPRFNHNNLLDITRYSISIYQEMAKVAAFNHLIGNLLPLNPLIAYFDLYF